MNPNATRSTSIVRKTIHRCWIRWILRGRAAAASAPTRPGIVFHQCTPKININTRLTAAALIPIVNTASSGASANLSQLFAKMIVSKGRFQNLFFAPSCPGN